MRAEGRETERHREWEGNATQMLACRGQIQTEIAMKGGNYSESEACCTPADIT